MSNSQIKVEELFDWLEQQPELAHLREQAASTPCEYRPTEPTPQLRLTTNAIRELPSDDRGPIGKLWEIVWVPGRNMRGKAFSTPELDASLSSVAKLMCISTLWDFVTTVPLFSYSLSLLTWASVPAGTALSFILLWASNVAGENATDRRPRHAAKANMSLAAFVLLSAAKTLTSGVGVDLMISDRAIAAEYAKNLATLKLSDDRKDLETRNKPDANLRDAIRECAELQQQLKELGMNREANNKQWTSVKVKMDGMNVDQKTDANLSAEELSKKYSLTKGVCRYKQALYDLSKEKNKLYQDSIEKRAEAQKRLPPLSYLEKHEPEIFKEHFRGSGDDLEWVNGSEAVGQAFDQFYKKLMVGKFGLLGFSLFTFGISVILTGAASIMLYMAGKNPQVQASFMGELEKERNKRLSEYETLAKKEEA